ncbi:MAG: SDR family NAD(P)-dependent oxidoreductase [Proteobacteria bacterium]|nr:SDR family NAD(P)-dependent oxidoreductase [Pseudomonadota bacterium]
MTAPFTRPKRKNPVLRTRLPLPPPGARSRAALGLSAAAAMGKFKLQVCEACRCVQYPPREACGSCLSPRLRWREQDGFGELLADTQVHLSQEPYFRERAPWRIGMVRLDAGPTVIVHLHSACGPAPCRVRVGARLDKAGQGVLIGFPVDEVANMADDRQLREMTCDPKFRKVLITDGKTAVGQALARTIIAAGADLVWVGQAEPWKRSAGLEALSALPQVAIVPLDLTDSSSVVEAAGSIGGRVDILINNAEVHRTYGISARNGTDAARLEMDVNYFGLLRLAQGFGPAMRGRAADGAAGATAWVNLLSIYALSNFPPHGTFSASKAAALSLSQALRAEMRGSGIRVINVFPGPIDDEWNQPLPPPKLAAEALAKSVVSALKDGVEDVYPGDVAQEWLARWEENPKVLERELTA